MTKPKHSSIGASGSHRWLECPGSVQAEANIKVRSGPNVYADEGSAAHKLAEVCLRKNHDAEMYLGDWLACSRNKDGDLEEAYIAKKRTKDGFLVDDSMVEHVQVYLDYVRSIKGKRFIESKIDLSHLHPDLYGTVDCGVLDLKTRTLYVIDLKFGKGVAVDVNGNTQLRYYGLGLLFELSKKYGINMVRLVVVQPRAPHADGPIRTWDVEPHDLLDFGGDLVKAAMKTRKPNAPRKAGEHCGFCKARPLCHEAKRHALETAKQLFKPRDGDTLGKLLKEVAVVKGWCRSVEEAALALAMRGGEVHGHKLVEGRAKRSFINTDALKKFLKRKFKLTDAQIHTVPELRSPAQIEKLIPAKVRKGALDDYVVKAAGRPTLAPASSGKASIAARDFFDDGDE